MMYISVFTIRNKLHSILQALRILSKVFLSTKFIVEEHTTDKIVPPNRTCQNETNKKTLAYGASNWKKKNALAKRYTHGYKAINKAAKMENKTK